MSMQRFLPPYPKKTGTSLTEHFAQGHKAKAVQSCNQKEGKREKNRGASAERPVRRWRPGSKDGHGAHAHVFESASAHSQQHALARRGVSSHISQFLLEVGHGQGFDHCVQNGVELRFTQRKRHSPVSVTWTRSLRFQLALHPLECTPQHTLQRI